MTVDPSHVQTKRIEIECDGQIGFVTYSVDGNGKMTLWHTEVPVALRKQGIGSDLVEKAFRYAKDNGLKVEVICPFAISYVARHQELRAFVAKRNAGDGSSSEKG